MLLKAGGSGGCLFVLSLNIFYYMLPHAADLRTVVNKSLHVIEKMLYEDKEVILSVSK